MLNIKRNIADELIYVPYLWRDVVEKVAIEVGFNVMFDWGHDEEVQKQLELKNGGMTGAVRTKFPLVWLVMDYPERRGRTLDLYSENRTQIIIAVDTDPELTMQKRAEQVYLPVLYPIYAHLLNELARDRRFQTLNRNMIPHTKVDRPYWSGGSNKAGESLFDEPIDAIEIKDLEIEIKSKTCW